MANFASKEGTLGVGVAQTFNFKQALGVNASSLVYSNDDSAATHKLTIDGQTISVLPGEQRVLSGVQNWDVLIIGGDAGSTGAYRCYASSDEPAPLFYKPYGGPVGTTGIADGAVTDAKLAVGAHVASAGALSTPFPVETLVLDVADGATPLAYTSLTGKHEIIGASVTFTGTPSSGNTKIQVKTAGGAAVITDTMTATSNAAGNTVYAASILNGVVASAADLQVVRVQGGGSCASRVVLTLMKVA